jgi:hypothetical protein
LAFRKGFTAAKPFLILFNARLEATPPERAVGILLPSLLVFEDDLQKRNELDAKYLIGLAELGLGNKTKAFDLFEVVLQINAMHVGAYDQLFGTKEFLKKT